MQEEQEYIETDFDVKIILYKYLKYWYLFVISIVFTLVFSHYYTWFSIPIYRVETKLLIQDEKSGTEHLLKQLNTNTYNKSIDNEIEILKSEKIISKTIENLNFEISYFLIGNVKTSERYNECPFVLEFDTLEYQSYFSPVFIDFIDSRRFIFHYEINGKSYSSEHSINERFSNDLGYFKLTKKHFFKDSLFNDHSYERKKYRIEFKSIHYLTKEYTNRLNIYSPSSNSSILVLEIEHPVLQKAKDFLNMLNKVYMENDVYEKNRIAQNTQRFITSQLNQINEELTNIEKDIETYKTKKGITNISVNSNFVLEKVQTLDYDISTINIKLEFLDHLDTYIQGKEGNKNISPSSIGINDPLLIILITKLQKLEEDAHKLNFSSGPNNPDVEAINYEIENTKTSLIENISSIREGLTASKKVSENSLHRAESLVKSMPEIERELLTIERQFKVKESLYLFLLEKQAETSILLASAISENKIIENAKSSGVPIKPIKSKNDSIALVLGFLFPLLFIHLKDLLNDKILDSSMIANLTKIPIIGVIGLYKEENKLINLDNPKSNMAEAFRSIRTNLKYFTKDNSNQVILVTSTISTEGKTFSAMNLASIISLGDKKTILLGLDLRKPKIVADFNITNDRGVSSYLIGSSSLNEIIQHTELPNLDIIPSGPIPPNPSELIMKTEMETLISELKKTYDTIIIDSPPIGLVTDGLLLTKFSDALIYVVRQNVTKKLHLSHLQELYKEDKLGNVSILFNAVKSSSNSYGYGYGYGGMGMGIMKKKK